MKTVLMFPGQGAQVVGMGRDLHEGSGIARRTFEEADDTLGYPLSQVCFEGPGERLTRTDVCQPALVAVSVAAWRVAADRGLTGDAVMGHSLGEYSGLVAAGAIPFATALTLVAERGAAMQEAANARPGAMVAVLGMDDGDVEALCAEAGDAWPANFNCPGQVVVSGTPDGVERIIALAGERNGRTTRLNVAGAFHSPLVASAAERLRPALDGWQPAPADPPFVSTTTCRVEPPERMRDVLFEQLTSPVRFGDAVRVALDAGAERFVELGTGKVLSGLVRRIRRDVTTVQVTAMADLDALPGG